MLSTFFPFKEKLSVLSSKYTDNKPAKGFKLWDKPRSLTDTVHSSREPLALMFYSGFVCLYNSYQGEGEGGKYCLEQM